MMRDHLMGFPAVLNGIHDDEPRLGRVTLPRPRLPAAEQELRRRLDAPGWADWHGGGCPVPPAAVVEFMQRDGAIGTALACTLLWMAFGGVSDIVRFRVLPDEVLQ
jgi:hypothetical protein